MALLNLLKKNTVPEKDNKTLVLEEDQLKTTAQAEANKEVPVVLHEGTIESPVATFPPVKVAPLPLSVSDMPPAGPPPQLSVDAKKYFRYAEFDSEDLKGSGKNMKTEFLNRLAIARKHADVRFVIKSGYRTQAHNTKVGGAKNSAHTKGWAADIFASDHNTRYKIISGLIYAGFNRIGVGKSYVHADSDPTLPPHVIWHYYDN